MPAVDTQKNTQSPVLSYARLLRQSHELIAQDKGDSPEAEALADLMDSPWAALTAQEQRRMRGLSTDLYALREGGPKRIEMSPDQLAAWQQVAKEANMRSELGDVDALLDFLRQPVPSNLPRHIVPFLQARCWEKWGDLETALVFMKEAERQGANHSFYDLLRSPKTIAMQTIRLLEKTDKDGTLQLRIPLGKPKTEYEVVLVLQPKETPSKVTTPEERGWPPGYFKATCGSIDDETFVRPPQRELPKPVDLE